MRGPSKAGSRVGDSGTATARSSLRGTAMTTTGPSQKPFDLNSSLRVYGLQEAIKQNMERNTLK